MIWNETKECMSRDEMNHLQSKRLVKLVDRVYHNVEFYRKKMQELGIEPGDIRGIEDLEKLPFTIKNDLRDNYPFGLFAVPQSQIVRVHASSGTTGKATVVGYTKKDIDIWAECVARAFAQAGLNRDDVIQVAYGYGLFTGGLGAHYGAEHLGATVVPMSTGNTKKLTTMMKDFGATAIACTPSYLLHIAETLEADGDLDKIKLKAAICGAEPWTEAMRKQIEEKLHINAFDIYGLSEIMGPGVACDCIYHKGLHVYEDHFLPEIIDPDTLKAVPEGETGELVFTTLTKEGIPLLRYRTRDLTSISYDKCECGRTLARISRFKGRSDDMLIIRGVNVFPSQVEAALLEMGEASPHYMMIVDRVNNLDTLEIQVEVDEKFFSDKISELENLTKKIAHVIQQAIGLAAKIKLVEPKTIERSMGKAVHVIDKRKLVQEVCMFLNQISVFLENRTGRLDEVLETIKVNDINILSLSLADTSDYGLLRMIVSDAEKCKSVLKEAGFSAHLTPVIAVKLSHQVGQLQAILAEIDKAGMNIEYMYALATGNNDASIVIRTADVEETTRALEKIGVELVRSSDLVQKVRKVIEQLRPK